MKDLEMGDDPGLSGDRVGGVNGGRERFEHTEEKAM